MHGTSRNQSNFLISDGGEYNDSYAEPFGAEFGDRRDPSIFTDQDGARWLVWDCAKIAKLKPNFFGFAGEEVAIAPSDRRLGDGGCTIRRIGSKYVLFGSAWSTDVTNQGTFNLYFCTADKLTGPYGPRRFAGRFCGHGTPFQDKKGRWWTTAFQNGEYETDTAKGQRLCDEGQSWTLNPQGLTLVPLEVTTLADGDIAIRANAPGYSEPGTEEVQKFTLPRATKLKPNILTVFIDDMGWSDLSCFQGDTVETQHIDRLASEGIRFTQFYVNSPICSPSRVALTTGQYPQRWRITSYLNNRKDNDRRGVAQWLDPRAPTLARELQKAGYATGHFGKWHMGGQRDVADAPPISAYGFDQSLTNFEGMGAKLLPLTMKPGQAEPGKIWENAVNLGEPVTWMQRSEITGGFVDKALSFIKDANEANQPFFVNVWPDDVHSPFFPPLDKWGDTKPKLYQGVLDAMDEQLARLFDYVRSNDRLRDNTLIIICSDNGHEAGAGTSDPLRGAKTWLYEGGIRSPLIVWGPGLIANDLAGTINTTSVFSAIDLNRSLYSIGGIQPAKNLDGEDLSETVLGKSQQSRTSPLFWRRPPDRPGFGHGYQEDNPDLAVRDGKWKYLVNFDNSDPQLYDLDADASESQNLAAKHSDIVVRLERAVRAWNAGMPVDGGDPKFVKPVVE
ncbi:MAG: sulfatase-like hydrolase/transferase [Verrucomicrobiales bacterium]